MPLRNQNLKTILKDPSLWSLVFSNLLTIYFAIKQDWDLKILLWAFCTQSLIEGLFYVRKMVKFIKTQTSDTNPDRHTSYDVQIKMQYPIFIIIIFSSSLRLYNYIPLSRLDPTDIAFIILAALLSLLNCLIAALYEDSKEKIKIVYDDSYMTSSYKRMFILYGTLILCLLLEDRNITLFFLILKAMVNIKLYIEEYSKSNMIKIQTEI